MPITLHREISSVNRGWTMSDNFAEFIRAKGVDAISSILAVPVSTIYSWSHRNSIPRDRWPDLMVAFPEIGLRDLLQMEAANERSEA